MIRSYYLGPTFKQLQFLLSPFQQTDFKKFQAGNRIELVRSVAATQTGSIVLETVAVTKRLEALPSIENNFNRRRLKRLHQTNR